MRPALILAALLIAGPALAQPSPAAPSPDANSQLIKVQAQQITELQKQLNEANQKGAYWMALAAALQKQRNAALDADVPLIAFPQQQGAPRQ